MGNSWQRSLRPLEACRSTALHRLGHMQALLFPFYLRTGDLRKSLGRFGTFCGVQQNTGFEPSLPPAELAVPVPPQMPHVAHLLQRRARARRRGIQKLLQQLLVQVGVVVRVRQPLVSAAAAADAGGGGV